MANIYKIAICGPNTEKNTELHAKLENSFEARYGTENMPYYVAFYKFNSESFMVPEVCDYGLVIFLVDLQWNIEYIESYCSEFNIPTVILLYNISNEHDYCMKAFRIAKQCIKNIATAKCDIISDNLIKNILIYIENISKNDKANVKQSGPGLSAGSITPNTINSPENVLADNVKVINMVTDKNDSAVPYDNKKYVCIIEMFDYVWSNQVTFIKILHIKEVLMNLYFKQSHEKLLEFIANDDTAKNIINVIQQIVNNDDNDVKQVKDIQTFLLKFGYKNGTTVLYKKKDYTCVIELFDSVWDVTFDDRAIIWCIKRSLINLYCKQSHAKTLEFINNDDIAKKIVSDIKENINDNKSYDTSRVYYIRQILWKFGQEMALL